MFKILNTKIKTWVAMSIIVVLAILEAGFSFWQYSRCELEPPARISIDSNSQKIVGAKQNTVPQEYLVSDDKILEYLGNIYCGIKRNNVSEDGIYARKLVAEQTNFFISVCSVNPAGTSNCSRGTTMVIYSIDRQNGAISTVWWSNVYVLAVAGQVSYSKSKINFEDIDGDENYEIVQDIKEMTCDSQCDKTTSCCTDSDYCLGNKIKSQEEYTKKFKWSSDKKIFSPIY